MGICSRLGHPQYEDAIEPEIAWQWRYHPYDFEVQARLHTQRYARQAQTDLEEEEEIDWNFPTRPVNNIKREDPPPDHHHQAPRNGQSFTWLLCLGVVLAFFLGLKMFPNLGSLPIANESAK